MIKLSAWVVLTLLAAAGTTCASEIRVTVTDKERTPLADAVVTVRPESADAGIASTVPDTAIIGQKNLSFIPFVTLIRRGGTITFTNNDDTGHQVYSFSPIKQFQVVLKKGEKSSPIEFDTAGVAAMGCNIHDQMLAYVYVSDAPLGGVTNDDGVADFTDIPMGTYTVEVWHPNLKPGAKPSAETTTVGSDRATISFALSVSKPPSHDMHKSPY